MESGALEPSAAEKYGCPACGAQAEWNPGTAKLVCVACGTQSPYEVDPATGQIREMDLVTAMRDLPDAARGWLDEKTSVRCRSCRAISVFDAGRVGQRCDFCGSPSLVPYEEIKAPIRPQGVLPFTVPESQVREQMRAWYARQPLAPGAFTRRALVEKVTGIYVPYWTFDAKVHCGWDAFAGYFVDHDSTSRKASDRQVQWEPVAGFIDHVFDDLLIPGTTGIRGDLLKALEPWPIEALVPYDRAYLSGFIVEHYQVVPFEAAKEVRKDMGRLTRNLCELEIPGDTFRMLHIAPEYSEETFKLILVPVWLLSYTYRGKTFQVVANGRTGTINGDAPTSMWKVLGVIVVLIALFLGALFGLRAISGH